MSTNHKESFLFLATIPKEHWERTYDCHKSPVPCSITCDPPFNESRVMFYLFEPVSALQSFHWRAIFKLRFLLASFLSLLRIDSLACFWFFPLCSAFLSFHLVWNGLVKLVACSHLAVPAAWFAILILGSESGSSFRSLGTFHHGRSLEALWYGQLQASSREFL